MSDEMDDGARRWLMRFARANLWRVSAWYDLDDLIQEGCFAYCKVLRRYPTAVDPAHRMALFKRVINSVICDLANKRTRRVPEVCFSSLSSVGGDQEGSERTSTFIEGIAADPDISEVAGALAAAPQYVQKAVHLFATDDGCRRLRSAYRRVPVGRFTRRETLNERLCRLVGCDPAVVDIVNGLRTALGLEPPLQEASVSKYEIQREIVVERVSGGSRTRRVRRVRGSSYAMVSDAPTAPDRSRG